MSRAAGTVLERLRLVEDDPTLLVRLGDGSIAKYVPPELVTAAADEIDRLRAALARIAGDDYRGPRPWSASFAQEVLDEH